MVAPQSAYPKASGSFPPITGIPKIELQPESEACFPLSFLPLMIQDSSMPIRPEQRWFYPIDWHQLSEMIRFQRAKGRCEQCGRPHGRDVVHLGDGRWFDEERKHWRNDSGRRARALPKAQTSRLHQLCFEDLADPALPLQSTRVVLASAHLDHDPSNNDPGTLAALCQRCHLAHDRPEHRRQR